MGMLMRENLDKFENKMIMYDDFECYMIKIYGLNLSKKYIKAGIHLFLYSRILIIFS